MVVVACGEPVCEGVVVVGCDECVAEDAVVDAASEGFDDAWCCGEVHVGNPEG